MPLVITVPSEIQIVDALGRAAFSGEMDSNGKPIVDTPWNFYRFLLSFVISDGKWGKGVDAAHAGYRLAQIFKNAKAGDSVSVDTPDWDRCRKVVKDPDGNWPMQIMIQFTPFFDVITKE